MDDCPFCLKIREHGDEHGQTFQCRDPGTVRFAPLNPVTEGHMLFVPRRHDEHPFNVGKAFEMAERWAKMCEIPSYNVIRSYGGPATQTVPHPHVHFVPRREGDGLTLPWTSFSKVTGRPM